MRVILTYNVITIEDAPLWIDSVGRYKLRVRKTPQEMKEERERKKRYGNTSKVVPYHFEEKTVMERDPDNPGTLYFMAGLWPRIKGYLDDRNVQYTIEDQRDPAKKPPLDLSRLGDVEFRENQDVAVALIATSDCGIINTPTGFGKCHHPDTPIIMYDGSIKKAKDIEVGELLMGDDSTPRCVLSTVTGKGPLYRYKPVHGSEYIFNGDHKLSVVHCASGDSVMISGKRYRKGDILDISVKDWLALPKWKQACFKGYRVGVDFPERPLPDLDPYFVGVYLGDGTESFAQITTPDMEILDYCANYVRSIGWSCRLERPLNKCVYLRIYEPNIHRRKTKAPICSIRQACGMKLGSRGKSIPDEYKFGSSETRLQLLAGLLDTDGYLAGTSTFEISTKWPKLADDIAFVARSLGFEVRDQLHTNKCQTGFVGVYHRMTILGHTERIPTKVPRKQAKGWEVEKRDPTHTGFEIEYAGDGDFCGFSVDGNHRYLLGDFTVTHNSFIISVLCKLLPTLRIVVTTSSTSVVETNYEYISKSIPGEVGCLTGKRDTTKGKRVIVTTLKSLAKIPSENVDLVIADECHDIGDTQAAETISQFYFARKFGFSASPVRTDGSAIVMESLFGPVILNMSYNEAVEAGMVTPMKYVMLPCSSGPEFLRANKDLADVVMKRYSYWCNKYRNRVIANFMYDLKKVSDAQVLIMVATLHHALELKVMMPWLVVAYYGNADMEDLRKRFPKSKYPNLDLDKVRMTPKQLDITRNAFAKGTLRWVVSTYVFRQGVNFKHLRVLVRADGTTTEVAGIQIPGRLSRLDEGKDCAYLVDLNDTFSDWAANRSQARAKLYQEQGWKEVTREELLNDLRTKPDDEPDDAPGRASAEAGYPESVDEVE